MRRTLDELECAAYIANSSSLFDAYYAELTVMYESTEADMQRLEQKYVESEEALQAARNDLNSALNRIRNLETTLARIAKLAGG